MATRQRRRAAREATLRLTAIALALAAVAAVAPRTMARPEVRRDPTPSPDEFTTTDPKAPAQCCPKGPLRSGSSPCRDSPDHVPLHCNEGYYRLEPSKYPEDRFRVDGSGSLLIGDNGEPRAPSDFCLATVIGADNETENTALVCFSQSDDWTYNPGTRNIINGVCLCVSVAFLVLTLLVYVALPELHDLDGRVIISYIASLAVADLVLAVLQFHGHHLTQMACVTQAFFLYFWLLAAFFWMNVVCFNVWRRTICLRLPITERHLFTAYVLYGFGVPLLLLVVAIFTEHVPGSHLRPQFGVSKCWFEEEIGSWAYFYGPVAVLLMCNMVFFVWSVWALLRDYSHVQTDSKLRSLRCKCYLYLKLAVLMGITWIFEIISFIAGDSPFFTYVTDVLNSLQGLLIFILLVVTRRRVLRLLVKRRPYGLAPPQRWAQGPDEESEAMLADEEPASPPPTDLRKLPTFHAGVTTPAPGADSRG